MTGSPVLASLLFTSYPDRPSGIENLCNTDVALSAWELACHAPPTGKLQVSRHSWLSVSARRVPLLTPLSGTQRARHTQKTIWMQTTGIVDAGGAGPGHCAALRPRATRPGDVMVKRCT